MAAHLEIGPLRTFLAAAEAMNFGRAALAVHRSPAAVSMQIRKLEEALGTPLFVRDTRNIALTPAGETLLGYARGVVRLHDQAVEAIRRPDVTGRVVVGAPDDYISTLLPTALREFARLFPRVEVEVVCAQTTSLIPQLADSRVDLAFVTRMRGVNGDPLRSEPMVWVAAAHADLSMRVPLPVALYEPGSVARANVVEALNAAGRAYRATHSSPSLLGLLAVVEAGLAVTALARCSVPPGMVILDERHGLPKLRPLDVALARSPASHRPACDALAEIVHRSVGGGTV